MTQNSVKTYKYLSIIYILISLIFAISTKNLLPLKIILVTIITIIIAIDAIKNKNYISLFFIGLTFELIAIMFTRTYLMDIKETSWREMYNIPYYNFKSITYIIISLFIIEFLYEMYRIKNSYKGEEIKNINKVKTI